MQLKSVVQAIAMLGITVPALAQQAPPQPAPAAKPQRVEITGSSIKRLATEGALAVEVIRADEMQQQGIVSAEDLLNQLSANSANVDNAVSRNSVFGDEQDRLTGGSSFANLRGLGPTGTLVLLNGRRVSTHGMSGGGVDLNAIPMAAVERVEILKDGASAIYGTDAIGGVINFILKTNYQGVSIGADVTQPLESSGGATRRVKLTAGTGSLEKNGWNLMTSLTVDSNTILRGIERDWATGFQPALGLSPDTTSSPHANIIPSSGTALGTAGSTVGSSDTTKYTNLNLLAMQGRCQESPFGVPLAPNIELWDKSGYTKANSTYRCGTDYARQFMLTPPKDALNLLVRGTMKLGDKHTAFVEFTGSRTEVESEFTPFQFSTTSNSVTNYPVTVGGAPAPYYLNLKNYGANEFDPTKPIAYRLRMWDWGYRTIKNTSENMRLAVGVDGEIGAYNYKVGLSMGQAEAWSDMIDGYADTKKLVALLASGKYNPFLMPGQEQSAEAKALIEDSKVRGRLFGGKTELLQFDGALSGELFKLPAGAVDFAVGFDARQESYGFSGSQTYSCVSTFTAANMALTNSVMGCPGNSRAPDSTRDIYAVYGELLVPVTKQLQLTLQARHDDYSQIGSTTNPKIAFRFQPIDSLVLRGSVNTGFRAPTVQQLNLGTLEGVTTGSWSDPVKCADPANPIDATQCGRSSVPYRTGGNPTLKPETSKQGTLGFALQPTSDLQVYADYWQVELQDRIRSLSPTFMTTNYALFADNFIRDINGNVAYIQAGWVNAAESQTKGLDMGVSYRTVALGGRINASLKATKMISHKERLIETAPLTQYVGEWSNTTLYLPWKATGSLGYRTGPWSGTLSVSYKSGYKDMDMSAYDTQAVRRDVASYTTFNLFGSYRGIKNLTLSAGLVNLFDRQPPFTWHNADSVIGAGWDPRVADPRGRTLSLSFNYEFK